MIFIKSKFADDVLERVYVNNTALTARVDHFIANNISAAAATLVAHIVDSGSPGDSNKVLTVEIEPDKAYLCAELVGADLGQNSAIWVSASAVDSIVIRCNGRMIE